jgi:hypothetical protein
MTEEPSPIAYTALRPGTPVQSSDGQPFGTVETVLTVEEVDVFDGLVVETAEGTRFVDADKVESIYTSYVRTTISPEEAANLPLPAQSPTYGVDAGDDSGSSIADRFGRMFGRGKWKRER